MASDPPENATLTGVPGILVGHAEEIEPQTGCTAILCPEGAVCGVDVRGFAPGSIETALLNPEARVAEVHGVLLTGGSSFGLAAAAGMVRWLAERGYGVETAFARVPLVPGAVIYDLNFNQSYSKPDFDTGYRPSCRRWRPDPRRRSPEPRGGRWRRRRSGRRTRRRPRPR